METIDIDFVGCLTRNNFLDRTDPNINIKAKLCLRLLLFLDSLHDFGDKSRTAGADADTAVKEKIMKKLLIKLLKDLKWILSVHVAAPDTPYLTMLKVFIINMFNEKTEQLNQNLKIYSIFFGSGNWPDKDRPTYNDIHQKMQQAPGAVVAENKYFSLIKESLPEVTRLYFYPTYIADATVPFNTYPETENINPEYAKDEYQDNIRYGIRCLFMKSIPKGGGVGGQKLHQNKGNSKYLHSYSNQLMNYIYQDPNDKNEKYIIFIIACLIYFWEPVTNAEGSPHTYIQYNNIELGSYVHDLFFQYILNYSLNCFTIIPTSNHNITAGAWQFMTSILQYLCFQIETNQGCQGKQQALYQRSLAKGNNYNLNTFFNEKVSVIIDAAGKPRSINYLTQCFIDIFKEPSKTVEQQFVLYNTSASKFDSAGVSNLQASMQQVDNGLVNETEYATKNYVFNIKCGGELIISIGFIYDATSGKFSVVFKKFFSDTFSDIFNDLSGYQVSQDYSSLTKSIEGFGQGHGDTKNNIYYLIAKSMGDFGQILFYYLLQYNSGYFSDNLSNINSLTIFHTLDTWAASICSLFAAGVICEESSDAIKIDEVSSLPYKYGNNKMFVSKHLRDQLLEIMTPSVYLPSINALNDDDIDVWSMVPLTLGQAQQCNKREKLLNEEIISHNQEITLLIQEGDNQKIQLDEAHSIIQMGGDLVGELLKMAAEHPEKVSADVIAKAEAYLQKGQKIFDPEHKQKLKAALTEIEKKLNEKALLVEEQIQPTTDKKRYYISVSDVAENQPTAKKPKLVGGVMTRAMAKQQQQLNNDIINSFQVLDDQISESKNYILDVTNWLTQHGIQLSPEYLHLAQKFINNVDNYEPVAARTRSKLLALNQTSTVAAARREVKAVSRQDRLKATVDPEKARREREEATKGIRATIKNALITARRLRAGGKLTRKHYKSKNPKNMEKIFKNLKI